MPRSWHRWFLLQTPDRKPGAAGADQRAVDFEPGRIAQRFEMSGGVVEFHEGILSRESKIVNYISRNIEIALFVQVDVP